MTHPWRVTKWFDSDIDSDGRFTVGAKLRLEIFWYIEMNWYNKRLDITALPSPELGTAKTAVMT